MNGVERDTQLLQDLSRYADMNAAELARAVGVSKSTIWRPASGKSSSRLSQPVLDKLKSTFPHFHGWADYLVADAKGPDSLDSRFTSQELSWLDLLRKLKPRDRNAVLHLASHLASTDYDDTPPAEHDDGTINFWDEKFKRSGG